MQYLEGFEGVAEDILCRFRAKDPLQIFMLKVILQCKRIFLE